MKKLNLLLLFLAGLLITACSNDDDPQKPDTVYKYLDKITYVKTETVSNLGLGLLFTGYGEYATILQSDVKVYRVSYYTQYQGKQIKASGALFTSVASRSDLPTVVYTHGTIKKEEAPSLNLGGTKEGIADLQSHTLEVFLGMALASAGNCAVLVPDYIGYGESKSVEHPYVHGQSLGQASFDFINACAEADRDGFKAGWLNPNLFITGYSEGGYAAVALQKKIQESKSTHQYTINKVIAGSGPYDHYSFAREFMEKGGEQTPHMVSTFLWTIQMYKIDYNYSKPYSDILSPEDDARLKATNYAMGYFLPEETDISTDPTDLFNPSFIQGVMNETDTEFINSLKDNSLTSFAAADSLILIYGTADDWVTPTHAENMYKALKEKACPTKLYTCPGGDHATTLFYYLDILLARLGKE